MLRKIFLLLLLVACSPKDAEIESKPFEEPTNDGFNTFSMQEPLDLNRASWFFWKRPEDMSTAMRLGGALGIIEKKMIALSQQKAALVQGRENYILESLGPDNKVIWEVLYTKHLANSEKRMAIADRIVAEEAKPEAEQDLAVIEQLKQELTALTEESATITEQIQSVEQQSGLPEFGTTIRNLLEQIVGIDNKLADLKKTALTYQIQLSQLVELVAAPPKLRLQETESGLYVELVDFKKDDVECNTNTGLIRNVIYKKASGYIEFTAICKQPDWSNNSQLVSYKIILEKIPTAPSTLLSGNMGRCVDKLPNVGKCEAGLATGVVKYQE